jgi:hypothetical protein
VLVALAVVADPGDLGHVLKPFVFLDPFDMEKASFPGIGLHPDSGIATWCSHRTRCVPVPRRFGT